MQNSIITVIYSHGRFGSPWYGFKIEALRPVALKMGINMISIRYPEDMPIEEMEDKLFNVIKDDVNVPGDLVLLSSSRGAYISTRISQKVITYFENEEVRMDDDKTLPKRHLLGQFLIAPAFYIKPEYYPDQNPTPASSIKTTIVHGFDDNVIASENSIKFSKLFKSQLYLIEGGHRLNSQRARLCLLFESFLTDILTSSDQHFENWLKDNPQETTQPDDWK
ncbi:MAG: hypothetical protein M0Q21_08170 [Ignavibacteriaceae bacterium]|nr:hypothetical protein [Ignavibacteriaceae bacterium]